MPNPIVTIADGQVKGTTQKDFLGGSFLSFFGIPYAKPPIGDLRFKAPVPAEPWKGVKNCTKEGAECPARHMMFVYQIGSEDNCLNLNVHVKNLPQAGSPSKPVMVWIHGGAFFHGSNRQELFGPHYLMSEDIVLVSINYRLGVLGFLSLEDPTLGVPGNAGMKDMILSLKWVQKNIANFGGDPNNVTIFGESAGAAAVHYLYISPMAKGLFHKAIAQSGSSLNPWARGEPNAKYIAKGLGYRETDEKKIFEYLKTCPVDKLIKAQHKHPDNFLTSNIRPYCPVIDPPSRCLYEESFMPKHPAEMLKEGNFNDVPFMTGYMSKEGIFFEAVRKINNKVTITKNFEDELYRDFNLPQGSEKSLDFANRIKKYYFGEEKPSEATIDQVYTMKSDNQFIHTIHQSVCWAKQTSKSPIYFYRMSLETPINYYKNICASKGLPLLFTCFFIAYKCGEGFGKNLFLKLSRSIPSSDISGACHADDLGYLFTSFLTQKTDEGSVEGLSIRRFVKMWTNFARCGNPTPPNENDSLLNVEWKPVTKKENLFLDIGKELKAGTNPDAERMQLWDSIYSECFPKT